MKINKLILIYFIAIILLLALLNKIFAQTCTFQIIQAYACEVPASFSTMTNTQKDQYLISMAGTIRSVWNVLNPSYPNYRVMCFSGSAMSRVSSGGKYYAYGYMVVLSVPAGTSKDTLNGYCTCMSTLNTQYPESGRPVRINETYFISNCSGYDENMLTYQSTSCFELGKENPLLPKNNGTPTRNGIWTKVVKTYTNILNQKIDSTFYYVISGGCSGIIENNYPLKSSNAKDSCFIDTIDMVPQTLCLCLYNNEILSGNCASNGLDTSCGGVNFQYGSKNDSIIMPCADQSLDSVPSVNPNDSNNVVDGFNKLLKGQEDQIKEQKASNLLLESIKTMLKDGLPLIGGHLATLITIAQGIANNTSNINNKMDTLKNHIDSIGGGSAEGFDSSYFQGDDSILTNQEGQGLDTTDSGLTEYDSTGLLGQLREKYKIDSMSNDTNITKFDSSDFEPLFEQFRVDQDTTCDCDPNWMKLDLMGAEIVLDICPWPIIPQIMKLLLNTLVLFSLSMIAYSAVMDLLKRTFV